MSEKENNSNGKVPGKRNQMVFDYKNPLGLYGFIEGAKITSSRNNGLSSKQQKQLRNAIKKSRNLGLLPNHYQSYDDYGRPDLISIKPFDYK